MANGLDPVHMTTEERLTEVAATLARGIRRLHERTSNHIAKDASIPLGRGGKQSRHALEPSPKGENA
jgi:hypothetical protein